MHEVAQEVLALRIVVVDESRPDATASAGERAVVDLLAALLDLGHDVGFYPEASRPGADIASSPLAGVEVVGVPGEGAAGLVPALDGVDLVIVSRPGPGARLLPTLQARPRLARALLGHDLHHVRLAAQQRLVGGVRPGELAAVRLMERHCWLGYDTCAYPSSVEADVVAAQAGSAAVVVPLYRVAAAVPGPPPPGCRLVVVGGSGHAPNLDAVRWTADEVLPAILGRVPDAEVVVVGDWPETLRPRHARVRFTGRVPAAQLDEELSAARVSLAPLRFGAGVKGKVVDALGRGLPVVGTGVALEGLDGVEVSGAAWVADEPDGIAAAVAALGDDDLWRTAAAAGPAWVQPRYGTGAHSAAVALWLAATGSRAGSRRAGMVE